jgi:hypothetical protein
LRSQRPDSGSDGDTNSSGVVPIEALKLLEGSFPVAMPELLGRSELRIEDFTDALDRLATAGLIAVDDVPDTGQVVRLTEHGVALKTP